MDELLWVCLEPYERNLIRRLLRGLDDEDAKELLSALEDYYSVPKEQRSKTKHKKTTQL